MSFWLSWALTGFSYFFFEAVGPSSLPSCCLSNLTPSHHRPVMFPKRNGQWPLIKNFPTSNLILQVLCYSPEALVGMLQVMGPDPSARLSQSPTFCPPDSVQPYFPLLPSIWSLFSKVEFHTGPYITLRCCSSLRWTSCLEHWRLCAPHFFDHMPLWGKSLLSRNSHYQAIYLFINVILA